MATRDELEQLSTKALHDIAIEKARQRKDVAFLWRLVKALPVAEEMIGDDQRAKTDIFRPLALINDFLYDADEGALGEALRPLYVEYLSGLEDG
ncbi:MAG TPA: hypothetical protein VF235_08070 [Actinomycetota bacterium]